MTIGEQRNEWCVKHGYLTHFVGLVRDEDGGDADVGEALHCPICHPNHRDNPACPPISPAPAGDDFWDRDDVQFARLLAEIKAAGLTTKQYVTIAKSMDVSVGRIGELLDRAEESFDAFKMQIDVIKDECAACGQKLAAKEA